jgi:hypothetical protein
MMTTTATTEAMGLHLRREAQAVDHHRMSGRHVAIRASATSGIVHAPITRALSGSQIEHQRGRVTRIKETPASWATADLRHLDKDRPPDGPTSSLNYNLSPCP